MKKASDADPQHLNATFADMETATRRLLRDEGVSDDRVRIIREIAMCYVGQSYQLRIDVPDQVDAGTWKTMTEAFHRRHAAAYGFANEREPTQFVNLRLTGIGKVDRPIVRQLERAKDDVARARKGRRPVYFSEAGGMTATDIYDRALLLAGDRFNGPAIVEQMDSTTVIPPGAVVEVDRIGCLVVRFATP